MPSSNYSVILHHLAPDATAAGLAFDDTQLETANRAELRDLINAFALVATKLSIYEPSQPEMRVKTEQSVFVIRARHGRLLLVGWEAALRGEEHSTDFILATVTETTEPIEETPRKTEARAIGNPVNEDEKVGFLPRWSKIALLVIVILGLNGFTAWMLFSPAKTTVPDYILMSESDGRALLGRLAGEFTTGHNPGDRQLVLASDGIVKLAKFGPQKSLTEQRTKKVRAAMVNGQPALITSDPSVLTIKDDNTVVLYRTTYRRHVTAAGTSVAPSSP